jgi:hypothetical protein
LKEQRALGNAHLGMDRLSTLPDVLLGQIFAALYNKWLPQHCYALYQSCRAFRHSPAVNSRITKLVVQTDSILPLLECWPRYAGPIKTLVLEDMGVVTELQSLQHSHDRKRELLSNVQALQLSDGSVDDTVSKSAWWRQCIYSAGVSALVLCILFSMWHCVVHRK